MQLWETDTRFRESVRNLPRAIRLSTVSAGLVTAVMGVTGPVVLVFQAAKLSNFTAEQTSTWIFAIFVGGGLMSLLLALMYRQPAAGAYSMAGSALLVQVLPQFGLSLAVGAYIMGALLILALALTGWFNRLMALLPPEIVMAMLAGLLFHFGAALFPELVNNPVVVGPTLLAYFVSYRFRRFAPPLTVAVVVAIVQTLVFYPPVAGEGIQWTVTVPQFYAPRFTLDALLSITLPLVLLALSSQNATGIGVLWALGYRPPITAITFFTGLFSLITAPMGGHGVNLATPMTAICGDEHSHPDPNMRYGAVVINGLLFVAIGVLGTTVVSVMDALPNSLIVTIAALAMIPVILTTLQQGFASGRRPLGAIFALVIAASNVTLFGVGAAFWSLVGGSLVTLMLDPRPAVDDEAQQAMESATE